MPLYKEIPRFLFDTRAKITKLKLSHDHFCMLFCTTFFATGSNLTHKKDIFRISTSHFDRFVAVDNLEKTVSTKIRQIVTV